jgi:hypothetical protein
MSGEMSDDYWFWQRYDAMKYAMDQLDQIPVKNCECCNLQFQAKGNLCPTCRRTKGASTRTGVSNESKGRPATRHVAVDTNARHG